MAEPESLEYLSHEVATRVVSEWIHVNLQVMRAGTGTMTEAERAVHKAINEIESLHLAEPHLLVSKLFEAMKLAGWTPPSGYVQVEYGEATDADR